MARYVKRVSVGNFNLQNQWNSNRAVCCVTHAKRSREGADALFFAESTLSRDSSSGPGGPS